MSSSGKASSERESDLQCASDFHAVLLGMAGHDLHLQVIKNSYEWLRCRLDSVRSENVERAGQKGLDLRIRPTRAVVMSNAVLLDGMVRNLVRNAIKYTDVADARTTICRRRLTPQPRTGAPLRATPKPAAKTSATGLPEVQVGGGPAVEAAQHLRRAYPPQPENSNV